MIDIEFCVTSFVEAEAALKYKAKRIELTSALELGGITPGYGLISACTKIPGIEVHVMIRPRPGNFVYDSDEIQLMIKDIEMVHQAGAKGVVLGALTESREIDEQNSFILLQSAKTLGLHTTFHRAFDLLNNPVANLEILIDLGFDRLLTSGQEEKAIEGIAVIQNLVNIANRRIQIMAGSGVNEENVDQLISTGLDALHFSINKFQQKEKLGLGNKAIVNVEKIEAILKRITG